MHLQVKKSQEEGDLVVENLNLKLKIKLFFQTYLFIYR